MLLATPLAALPAAAQFSSVKSKSAPVSNDQPVFYQSDSAEYDRDNGIVTLTGHVEIWQGERDLRADKVRYDRNTGVVAASGHVVLLEPDGQVLFGDYAELTGGMKNGIVTNPRAQLADNGHLAANGGRRVDARVNELSRAIYSTCDACKDDPNAPLLWDLRARSAVQDLDDKRIEYTDAVVDFYGVPVMYLPYFSQPDPSRRRASGFLSPSAGNSTHLGLYTGIPYFWAIDDSTDATFTPVLATQNGPALEAQFRHQFNDGTVTINAAAGYSRDPQARNQGEGDVFATGVFDIDDEWRWGFNLARATNVIFLRDFLNEPNASVLTSNVYLEGFGQGSYSRLDVTAFQGTTDSTIPTAIPYVLPRYEYSLVGEPDALGGRASVDLGAFNVVRQDGTNTQRVSFSPNWERPFNGQFGDLWKLVLHLDSAGYVAHQIDAGPTYGSENAAQTAQAMPTAALELHWPFQRDAGSWGTQVVEPIVQLIAAPNGGSYGLNKPLTAVGTYQTLIPNEDSLDYEFTDASLFSLNRFYGIDRLEGGLRANVGLRADWFFPHGQSLDAQIGQGYRTHPDDAFPVGSGLNDTVTDIVGHVTYTPNSWIDFSTRERFDHQNLDLRFADALVTGGPSWLRLNAGYLYTPDTPLTYYDTAVPNPATVDIPRNEISLGASTSYGHWRAHAAVRRDLELDKLVNVGVGGAYEDECFIFDVEFNRRYTSLNGDGGATSVLFEITLKSVGSFGYNAL